VGDGGEGDDNIRRGAHPFDIPRGPPPGGDRPERLTEDLVFLINNEKRAAAARGETIPGLIPKINNFRYPIGGERGIEGEMRPRRSDKTPAFGGTKSVEKFTAAVWERIRSEDVSWDERRCHFTSDMYMPG